MKTNWLNFTVWALVILALAFGPGSMALADGKDDSGNGKGKDKTEDKDQGDKGDKDKVTICHKGQTLSISRNALQAHLNHGDTLGPCNVTPSQNR